MDEFKAVMAELVTKKLDEIADAWGPIAEVVLG
jgi:hypothetical protein